MSAPARKGSNPPAPGQRPAPPANPPAPLSERLRAGAECAPWVIEEIRKLEAAAPRTEVSRQLLARERVGLAKYGVTLDRRDLSAAEWLQHLAEELMDGAGYALCAKRELLAAADAEVWLFKGTDGAWRTFHSDRHRLDTIADGRWEVRKFTALPQRPEPKPEARYAATIAASEGRRK